MRFEWDPVKDHLNLSKHGISFKEAATVFNDPLHWTIADPDHSFAEHRFLTTGYSEQGQIIIVSHTEETDDRIRIISARQVTAAERRVYEEGW